MSVRVRKGLGPRCVFPRGQRLARGARFEALERRDLLAIAATLRDDVLSIVGDAADDVVELRAAVDNGRNTVQIRQGDAWRSYPGAAAIEFEGGGGDDLLVFEDSTLEALAILATDAAIRLRGSLRASGAIELRAAQIDVQAEVQARQVNLFGERSLEMSGQIVAPAGTVRLESGLAGATVVRGALDVSAQGSSGAGGRIHVLGQSILLDGARLSAIGNGGGEVLVGGGAQGRGPLPLADATTLRGHTVIDASASDTGDGGTVVVWSELSTRIAQTSISARGGRAAGSGGLIETSGRQGLAVAATVAVDATASAGTPGTWLLDPRNVTIADAATSGGLFEGTDPIAFDPTADDAVVNRDVIQASLNSGVNVIIMTGTTGTQAGNITVVDPITRAAGFGTPTLTLLAAGNIALNAAISGSQDFPLNVVLSAVGNVAVAAPVDGFGGSFASDGADFSTSAAISASTVQIQHSGSFALGAPMVADTIDIDVAGNVLIGQTLTAATAISIRAGNDGSGNLAFGVLAELASPAISLRAGNGSPLPTARVIVDNATFRGASAGATSPTTFELRQDAPISDADLPTVDAPNQFGDGVPVHYTIVSDGGTLSLTDSTLVGSGPASGVNLRLGGTNVVLDGALELASLEVLADAVLGGQSVTTSGPQTYAGQVVLLQDTQLASTDGGAIGLLSTVNGAFGLVVNTAGDTLFADHLGNVTPLASLATDAAPFVPGGTTTFNASSSVDPLAVNTTGDQTYRDAVVLAQDTEFTSANGDVAFAGTVDGPFALRVDAERVILGGRVGTLAVPLATVTVDGDTAFEFAGSAAVPSVATSGVQQYNGAATLTGDTVLSSASGTVIIGQSIGGNQGLTIFGEAEFNQPLGSLASPLASLTVNGSTTFAFDPFGGEPSVVTSGGQLYAGDVVLVADTTLTSTSAGQIRFAQRVNGAFALIVNTAGDERFEGPLGDLAPLELLRTDDDATRRGGRTVFAFDGAARTSLEQTFHDAVVLERDTVLTSLDDGPIRFFQTVNGPFALSVNTRGDTLFADHVGNTAALTRLVTDAAPAVAGGTTIFGLAGATSELTVAVTIDERHNDHVELRQDTVLGTALANVVFAAALDGNFALRVAGNVTFADRVGTLAAALFTLSVAGTATFAFGGVNASPNVATTGFQTYGDVELEADTVLTSTSGGQLLFTGTVNGPFALTVNSAGDEEFRGRLGNLAPLGSLTSDDDAARRGGAVRFNVPGAGSTTPTVRTSGGQAYNDAVELLADTVLSDSSQQGAGVTALAASAARSPRQNPRIRQDVDASGNVTARDLLLVINEVRRAALPTAAATRSASPWYYDVNGDGAATPHDALLVINAVQRRLAGMPLAVAAAAPLATAAAGAIVFESTINGAFALEVNAQGDELFNDLVGNVQPLASLATDADPVLRGGRALFQASGLATSPTARTTGPQTYFDAVELTAAAVFSSGGGTIRFASTVDGPGALEVTTPGNQVFESHVAVASLTTDAGLAAPAGATVFGAPGGASPVTVTTSAAQTYRDALLLIQDASLTSDGGGPLTFERTLDGAGGLTARTTGPTTLGAAVGGSVSLAFLTLTTGGPFHLRVPVTAAGDITISVTRMAAGTSSGEDLLLDPETAARVLSTSGDIVLTADNDIRQLVSSRVEAASGSVVFSGDARHTSAAGGRIELAGRIQAPSPGALVSINGNLGGDVFRLEGDIDAPRTDVNANGGFDLVDVLSTLAQTTTGLPTALNLLGGTSAGSSLTSNIGSPAGSLDPIQGTINILGAPYGSLPSPSFTIVDYTFSAGGDNPPVDAELTATTRDVLQGNRVNLYDAHRAGAADNLYTLSGDGFQRAGSALIRFLTDASLSAGIQTVELRAGLFGNNLVRVQMPPASPAWPLTRLLLDGGEPPGTLSNTDAPNTSVLEVTAAAVGVLQSEGTIGGAAARLNALVAGDGSLDPTGPLQPITFAHFASLYLRGSHAADLLVNNSSVFSVFDGNGGGDWMLAGAGETVLYGGGAPAGRSVFMFGRPTGSGFFLPNTSASTPQESGLGGTSYLDGSNGNYSAVASQATIKRTPGRIYMAGGALDVISWLRASFERAPSVLLDAARRAVARNPRP